VLRAYLVNGQPRPVGARAIGSEKRARERERERESAYLSFYKRDRRLLNPFPLVRRKRKLDLGCPPALGFSSRLIRTAQREKERERERERERDGLGIELGNADKKTINSRRAFPPPFLLLARCTVPTLFLRLFLSLPIGDLTSRVQSQPVPGRGTGDQVLGSVCISDARS